MSEGIKQIKMAKSANTKANAIDRVTTERLDMALRLSGINLGLDTVDRIIDTVELIEKKGGKTSLNDITNLQIEWGWHNTYTNS